MHHNYLTKLIIDYSASRLLDFSAGYVGVAADAVIKKFLNV